MTTDFDNFDPEQVQVSNAKLTVGQVALFSRVARGDYEALIQLLVERTGLTANEIIHLPNDDRFMRLVERMRQGAEQAVTVAQLEKIVPPELAVDWTKPVELAKARTSPVQPRHDIIAVTAALLLVAVLAISVSNAIRQQHWITLAVTVVAIVLLLYMAARKPKH